MPRLCFDCENILRAVDQLFTDKEIDGYTDENCVSNRFTGGVRGWITAATEGTCDLCFVTYSHHEPHISTRAPGEITDDDVMTWYVHCRWQLEDWARLVLKSSNRFTSIETYFQRQSLTDEEVSQLKASGSEAGCSTWGPRTAKAIRNWLGACVSSHVECRRSLSNSTLPIRLVDVSPDGTRTDVPITVDDVNNLSIDALPRVNLCSTANLPSDTNYLTLSHCWGRTASIKLSSRLLDTYESQIPLVDLLRAEAKVFREAIWITRCLGYRYLWIDALCINQEDENEKSDEISRMDQIFSRADANLSATSASSGADGMIFNRKYSLYEVFSCEWKLPALEWNQDGTLQAKKDYLVVRVSRETVNDEPVNRRAWVFQERILSPRVIHFCRNTIYRECTRQYATELQDYSPWIALQPGLPGSHMKYAQYESMEGIDDTKMGKEHWSQRFRDLVQCYSSTLLTFPQDRLASLAGIAKNISVYGGLKETEYFAGLWELDLPRALIWRAQNRVVRKWDPEHVGYISPSWSWAGCEAPWITFAVDHRGDQWENLAAVIHVWTEPKLPGGSRFGALSDGAITLKGRLVEMHRKRIGDAFLVSIRDGDSILESELYFEARVPRTNTECRNYGTGRFKEVSILWDRFTKTSERTALTALQMEASIDLSAWGTIEPEVLYLLPIGQYCWPSRIGHEDDLMMEGLVLCRDDTTGRFKRVGIFETFSPYRLRYNEELRVRLLGVPETELTIV